MSIIFGYNDSLQQFLTSNRDKNRIKNLEDQICAKQDRVQN